MPRLKRPELVAEARRVNQEQLARLGGEIRSTRRRRRMTQADLARRVGVAQSTISHIERGVGGSLSLDVWQRVFVALGRRLDVSAGRDPLAETADAGHLAIQELVLRLGRRAGYARSFELPSRPADPSRSTDVGLRDDRRRTMILGECWNTIGDLGAAARATSRMVAEAEELAVAVGGERPFTVRAVWVVRATARNRALIARYPEVFAARFPGSSARWVAALTTEAEAPAEPGLVWCDGAATRLFAWRRR
jgi:transcriptional regulator with XRE-family HTH domain